MPVNLPIGPLRTFVTIADEGSMRRATERVFLTQSALSLQIKRLEDMLGAPLFLRLGRQLVLTPDGERLLEYARELLAINDRAVRTMTGDVIMGPVRIGLIQDFADTLLPDILARFVKPNPESRFQIRVAGSQELREMVEGDRLDLALCVGPESTPDAVHVVPMRWLGDSHLAEHDVVPLALMEQPCLFRDAAIKALNEAGRKFHIVVETASFSALRAAVKSGIAITCRTDTTMSEPIIRKQKKALPALPGAAHVLLSRPSMHESVRRLANLLASAAADVDGHVADESFYEYNFAGL